MTLKLTATIEAPEILNATAERLIAYGCTERQAYSLSRVITLRREADDDEVGKAVIAMIVGALETVHTLDIEYLGGQRRNTLRMEER